MTEATRERVYSSVNQPVLARVPLSAKSILDVGCGDGTLGLAIKERAHCSVTGITFSGPESERARGILDRVIEADLDHSDLTTVGRYDAIVCSHVLEHLRDPGRVLAQLREDLTPGGTLVIALPNPLLWRQRFEFLAGRFRYTPGGGLMDDTHLRFFDWMTARQLVEDAGYRVEEMFADGGFPGSRFLPAPLRHAVDGMARDAWPGLVGVQFVVTARA